MKIERKHIDGTTLIGLGIAIGSNLTGFVQYSIWWWIIAICMIYLFIAGVKVLNQGVETS